MHNFKLLALLCLFSLLAACAPGATLTPGPIGESASNPLVFGEDKMIFGAGQTYYISVTSGQAADSLDARLPYISTIKARITKPGKSYYSNLPTYDAETEGLPSEWVKLESARGVRKIAEARKSSQFISLSWLEGVEFVFSLNIPADAMHGPYLGTVVVRHEAKNKEARVPLIFAVDNPLILDGLQASR